MPVKIKNHVVTRGYLARWSDQNEKGHVGTWYFDLRSREIRFSKGLRASFAVRKGIYAPYYAGGVRDDRLENWFAESEGHLCDFLRKWSSEKPKQPNVKFIRQAITGCVSLGYRSEYSIEVTRQRMSATIAEADPDRVVVKALNSVYKNILHQYSRFMHGLIIIIYNTSKALLTNDQPFTDYTPKLPDYPLATFFAGPRTFIIFLPNHKSHVDLQIGWVDGSLNNEIASFAHLSAMRTARRWVVCPSSTDAEEVKAYLTEERIAEVSQTDRFVALPVDEIRQIFPT